MRLYSSALDFATISRVNDEHVRGQDLASAVKSLGDASTELGSPLLDQCCFQLHLTWVETCLDRWINGPIRMLLLALFVLPLDRCKIVDVCRRAAW
jgi:hypothetical protein